MKKLTKEIIEDSLFRLWVSYNEAEMAWRKWDNPGRALDLYKVISMPLAILTKHLEESKIVDNKQLTAKIHKQLKTDGYTEE